MINAKLQNIIDTKSAIGNAIVNKGGTITSETPFFNYAAQIDGISTGGGAYSTYVVEDITGAKYTAFNGYDALANPNPTNIKFNQWLLNNSASGDVVITNTIMSPFIYRGPNSTINISSMPSLGGGPIGVAGGTGAYSNDGFIYLGNPIRKYKVYDEIPSFTALFPLVATSSNYGGTVFSIVGNNGFIYAGGATNQRVQKFHELNLVFVNSSNTYGGTIQSLAINNGYIYASGDTNRTVQKFHESNLAFVGATASYGGDIKSIAINNGFLYVGGYGEATNGKVQKFYESNLARENNSVVYSGGYILTLAINNGYVYVGGFGPSFGATNLSKYHADNLAFVGNSVSYDSAIETIKVLDNFVYFAGRTPNTVYKSYESNLTFLANSPSKTQTTTTMLLHNGVFMISNGAGYNRVAHQNVVSDNSIAYTIKEIKE
jgi:hypothetical protein